MNRQFTSRIRNIPTLPTVLAKIIAMLDDSETSATDLEKVIRYDPALTAKLLAVANSPYYGFMNKVTSTSRAVVAIGYNEVRNLCLGISLMNFMNSYSYANPKMAEHLWLHAVATSEAARLIAQACPSKDGEIAFTAGLLHDIGKIVLAAFFPDELSHLLDLVKKQELTVLEAEAKLALKHEKVGEEVAKHWDLPTVLTEVIGCHHRLPFNMKYPSTVALTHAADYLAKRVIADECYHLSNGSVLDACYDLLQIDEDGLMECAKNLHSRQENIYHLWKSMITNA